MADPQEQVQYIKLPDGSYGKFSANATDDEIRGHIQKDFPDAFPKQEEDTGIIGKLQHSFDENTRTNPKDPLLETGLKSLVGSLGASFIHPLNTAKGLLDLVPDSPDIPIAPTHENPIVGRGIQAYHDYKDGGLGYSATKLAGEALGNIALGEAAGAANEGMGSAASAARDAAIGDPNAAALRGLQVGPRSPKALRTLSAVEGARPFLQGATSLEDLQTRVPAAKSEIWGPYLKTLEDIGDKPTGFGSVQELEDQRLQTSALLRNLKSRNPEAIQLAQQKGLSESNLMDQDRQLRNLIDSEMAATGLDSRSLRKSFGDVSQVGKQVSGKSTLIENEKPSGIGKVAQLSFEKPLQAPGQVLSGLRDLVAGRPMFAAKPTDLAIKEAFRKSGPKPDFMRVLSEEEKSNPFINKSRSLVTK